MRRLVTSEPVGLLALSRADRALAQLAPQLSAFTTTPLWWDPANSTGNAADTPSTPTRGTDATVPFLTWQGLSLGFWGTYSPICVFTTFTQVIINMMSSQPNTRLDNVRVHPFGANGFLLIKGTVQTIGTGALVGVLPKNSATRQPLQATLVPSAGAITTGMRITNTSRGNSYTHVISHVSGNDWVLEQPLGAGLSLIEDDTWANGDNVSFQTESTINLSSAGAQDGSNFPIVLQDLTFNASVESVFGGNVYIYGCVAPNNVTMLGNNIPPTVIANTHISSAQFVSLSPDSDNSVIYGGGSTAGFMFGHFYFQNDFISAGGMFQFNGLNRNVWVIGNSSNNQWNVCGAVQFKGYVSGIGIINVIQNGYSDGIIGQGRVQYIGAAASTFLLQHSGGNPLQINGSATADAMDRTVSPAPFYPGRALSPSLLDTTVAGGGFAGSALGPNGSAYAATTH